MNVLRNCAQIPNKRQLDKVVSSNKKRIKIQKETESDKCLSFFFQTIVSKTFDEPLFDETVVLVAEKLQFIIQEIQKELDKTDDCDALNLFSQTVFTKSFDEDKYDILLKKSIKQLESIIRNIESEVDSIETSNGNEEKEKKDEDIKNSSNTKEKEKTDKPESEDSLEQKNSEEKTPGGNEKETKSESFPGTLKQFVGLLINCLEIIYAYHNGDKSLKTTYEIMKNIFKIIDFMYYTVYKKPLFQDQFGFGCNKKIQDILALIDRYIQLNKDPSLKGLIRFIVDGSDGSIKDLSRRFMEDLSPSWLTNNRFFSPTMDAIFDIGVPLIGKIYLDQNNTNISDRQKLLKYFLLLILMAIERPH